MDKTELADKLDHIATRLKYGRDDGFTPRPNEVAMLKQIVRDLRGEPKISDDLALEALAAVAEQNRELDVVSEPTAAMASFIERRYSGVGPFDLGDVRDALMRCVERGLARHVKYGRGEGFALTEQGLEAA